MKHSVLLLTRYDRLGPSSRVRHYNYIPGLRRGGFDITVAPLLDDEYLDRLYSGKPRNALALLKAYWCRIRQLLTARRYDLIWIEKEALPWLPAILERAFFGKRPIVIDFDDAWYLRYAAHPNPMVRALLGNKFEKVISGATAVTTGNTALRNWAKASNSSHVFSLPSVVDLDRYRVMALPDGPFTIGWIGTPTNAPYLELIAEPLRYMQRNWGARVRVIGAERFSLPALSIDHVPWQENTEALELAACHVGVMPLANGPWEQGKCGYKLVQYMAAGRPAVASPIGASSSIIVPGQTGYLANSPDEWVSALSSLAADREQTRKLGVAGRRRAEAIYSLKANLGTVTEVFKAALSPRNVVASAPSRPSRETAAADR